MSAKFLLLCSQGWDLGYSLCWERLVHKKSTSIYLDVKTSKEVSEIWEKTMKGTAFAMGAKAHKTMGEYKRLIYLIFN